MRKAFAQFPAIVSQAASFSLASGKSNGANAAVCVESGERYLVAGLSVNRHRGRFHAKRGVRLARSGIRELERGKFEQPVAQRAHSVREPPGVAVCRSLGARIVDLPRPGVNFAGQARRMERREIGVSDEIYRQRHRIADMHVAAVERGLGAENAAGNPVEQNRADRRSPEK